MKKRNLVLCVALFISLFLLPACFEPPRPVGEWIASGTTEAIIFGGDNTFKTLYYGYDYYPPPPNAPGLSDGSRIPGSGRWRLRDTGTYTVDFSKNPAWIDLVITKQGSSRRQQGLIQFLDDNTFYMAVDDVRPASIESSSRRTRCTRAAPNEIKSP
jgi:hypothetical protein